MSRKRARKEESEAVETSDKAGNSKNGDTITAFIRNTFNVSRRSRLPSALPATRDHLAHFLTHIAPCCVTLSRADGVRSFHRRHSALV